MEPVTKLLGMAGLVLLAGGTLCLAPGSFAKDQTRILHANRLDVRPVEGSPAIGVDETAPPSMAGGGAARLAFALDRVVLPDFGPPGPDAAFRGAAPLAPPYGPMFGGPPIPPMGPGRPGCDERIDRQAAVTGYLKSKLRLQGAQMDAWQKIEQAAQPVVEKMREICASLPLEPGAPPALPTTLETLEKQLSVHAEFVHAIRGPVQALYDTLSPQQRAVLDRPPMF
jgi:hypothetical protein